MILSKGHSTDYCTSDGWEETEVMHLPDQKTVLQTRRVLRFFFGAIRYLLEESGHE